MLTTDLKFGEVQTLSSLTVPNMEKVTFTNILDNGHEGIALLTFSAGQELTEHIAPAEVMVLVTEGELLFEINGTTHTIQAGQFILMGNGVRHSVEAVTDAKVLLVKIKP